MHPLQEGFNFVMLFEAPQNGNHPWILNSISHDQSEVIINALEHLKEEFRLQYNLHNIPTSL